MKFHNANFYMRGALRGGPYAVHISYVSLRTRAHGYTYILLYVRVACAIFRALRVAAGLMNNERTVPVVQ